LKRLPDSPSIDDLHIYQALSIAQFLGLRAGFGQHPGLPPVTDFAGSPKSVPPREDYGPMRDLFDHLRAQAEEYCRLAKSARDRWIAKLLENLGHPRHARADQLESRDDRAQD
jgi:hypothetical protein